MFSGPTVRMLDNRLIEIYQQQYNLDHIPTLFVATKSDLDLAQQVSDQDDEDPFSHGGSAARGAARCVLQKVGAAGSGGS